MKKNIIIISIIIIAILAILIVILYMANKKKATPQVPAQQNISNTLPVLPAGGYVEVNQGNIQNAIEQKIQEGQAGKKDYSEIGLKTKNNQPLTLNDFIKAENIEINKKVYDNLSQSRFRVFSCCANGNECKTGLIFTVDPTGKGNALVERYKNVSAGLQDWETSLLQNTKNLLFKDSQISSNVEPQFKSTEFITKNGANKIGVRYANFQDVNGKNLSIDYAFFDNQIFISNDKDCIRGALNQYEDVLEP